MASYIPDTSELDSIKWEDTLAGKVSGVVSDFGGRFRWGNGPEDNGSGLVPAANTEPPASGLAPYNIPDKSVRNFVESPYGQQIRGAQNIGNLPMGEFLRMSTNTPMESPIAPPAPTGTGLVPPAPGPAAMATPMSAADRARADAMNEWKDYQSKTQDPNSPSSMNNMRFSLSPDFFARHPDVNGGIFISSKGIKFLFSDNKPPDIVGQAQKLIQDYTDKISSGQAVTEGRVGFYTDNIRDLMAQVSGMTTANTGASKAPSEIAQNTANANRAQVANVPIGPEGQTGAFSLVPGQPPKQFATGTPAVTKPAADDYLINKILPAMIAPLIEQSMNPLLTPEERAKADKKVASITQYAQGRQTPNMTTGAPRAKPTRDEFLRGAALDPRNKGFTIQQLDDYFYKTYGR